MKKLLLVALLGLFTFSFTGCNKDEDPPTPEPVVTTTPTPTVVVKTFTYKRGTGFSDLNLEVRDLSNNQIFFNNITNSNSVSFSINEDQTYTYSIIANGNTFYETGTYGYSSTSGLWYTPDSAPGEAIFLHSGTFEVTIYDAP